MQHEAASFSVADLPVDGKGFDFEERVMEEQARFGVWLFQRWLEQLDDALFENRPGDWVSLGRRERVVETVVGTVHYSRRVYKHRHKKARWVPVDEFLGLKKGARVSPGLEKLSAELATQMPFRAAAQTLWRLRRAKISGQGVHNQTQELGQRRVDEVRQEVKQLWAHPGESAGQKRDMVIFLEVDSLFVRTQRHRRKKNGPRHIEMRLAVVHEGWSPETPAGKRYRLIHKRVVVEATTAEAFWEAVSAELARTYDLGHCRIVINGDGAEWIRRGVEYFPQAVFQLDRFHWLRALRRAVGNSVKALRQMRDLLEEGAWDEAERWVRSWQQAYPERKALLEEFWQYVWTNREHLGDWRKRMTVELAIARGLGAAESNIDTVLVSRFKRHRRSWSVDGANRLGHLVALRHTGVLGTWLRTCTLGLRPPLSPPRPEPAAAAYTPGKTPPRGCRPDCLSWAPKPRPW